MASVTNEDRATEGAPAANIAQEEGRDRIVKRTDLSPRHSDGQSSSSTNSTTTDEGDPPGPERHRSVLARLKNFRNKSKDKILNYFRTIETTAYYVEYFNPDKRDRKALKTILSKLSPAPQALQDMNPRAGVQIELHIPANNTCQRGTQGFMGLVDTGARGVSLVRASVVEAVDQRYIPIENLPSRQQEYASSLRGLGDSRRVEVLGSTVLPLLDPDAPGFIFHSKFFVVPDTALDQADFLLGTDFTASVVTNFSVANKIKQRHRAILSLFSRTIP
ncbi:uncharacterized protein Z520_02273 [Fonsecaea multimorphosa CBS 102226]|uniref:Uncharacterized protein n=1 Tax=Fonsecaea multimorphosa CBS 102226 TaxID=1442371 RepID=A0A0D2KFB8_9EURO|nr:uncharacterized protein Z520_02273 [Fonsecaea multimorphosa CBS 102226]KIY02135.1 hypothetical protein Z520_02273 [Fonsecaea multimorphosa CBS 102226]OAL29331.1 hypothetical protein AYO22_02225 [Fonsecaea multimorphosa]